ncbi:MAG: membrane protein [Methylibium sp. NZG]|nr:MAG: membrane protein [Methylibium sp. NZG]
MLTGLLLTLAACASPPTLPPESPPLAAACPAGVPAGARCLRGQDSAASHYLIVMPAQWSGVLVVHSHGGPTLGPPKASRADEDAARWAITVREGHAWAASVFRQGGFAVTTAAEDTERVRRIFVEHVARPRVTLLHGQSWGAMVATRAAEMFPASWQGILLTSGVVAGPSAYDFRLDLRAVYQHLCKNHPRPDEPQYPLSIGMPADSKLSSAELASRADECLGLRKPAAQRTPEQAQKLKTIADVIRIPESSVLSHLNWATFTLRDVVEKNGGASPFGNQGVIYTGSPDDAALNAAVPRFKVDPAAAARFASDVDHRGRFNAPVLTAHGVGDATVFVEGHHTLRQRMQAAGTGASLVQTFIDSSEHSYWGDAHYPPLFAELLDWVERGKKPTPAGVAARCRQLTAGPPTECRYLPDYAPQPVASRVRPR